MLIGLRRASPNEVEMTLLAVEPVKWGLEDIGARGQREAEMAKPAWHIAVPGIMIVFAACSEASATYVGDRYFPSTVVTIVPTPADFLNFPHYVLLPETTTDTREHDFLVTYSKLITKDWALFFSETYRLLDETDSGTVSGFENLVLGTQYQLYTVPEHQFVVTVGGTASLGGTGSKEFGTSYSTLTPTIYVGQGPGRPAGVHGVAPACQPHRQSRRRAADGKDGRRRHRPQRAGLELRGGIHHAQGQL